MLQVVRYHFLINISFELNQYEIKLGFNKLISQPVKVDDFSYGSIKFEVNTSFHENVYQGCAELVITLPSLYFYPKYTTFVFYPFFNLAKNKKYILWSKIVFKQITNIKIIFSRKKKRASFSEKRNRWTQEQRYRSTRKSWRQVFVRFFSENSYIKSFFFSLFVSVCHMSFQLTEIFLNFLTNQFSLEL